MSEVSRRLFTLHLYDKLSGNKVALPKYAHEDWSESKGKEYSKKYGWDPETYKIKRDPRTGFPYYKDPSGVQYLFSKRISLKDAAKLSEKDERYLAERYDTEDLPTEYESGSDPIDRYALHDMAEPVLAKYGMKSDVSNMSVDDYIKKVNAGQFKGMVAGSLALGIPTLGIGVPAGMLLGASAAPSTMNPDSNWERVTVPALGLTGLMAGGLAGQALAEKYGWNKEKSTLTGAGLGAVGGGIGGYMLGKYLNDD